MCLTTKTIADSPSAFQQENNVISPIATQVTPCMKGNHVGQCETDETIEKISALQLASTEKSKTLSCMV
jgi:hypothetical protein